MTALAAHVRIAARADTAAWAVLDAEERTRAAAFRFQRDRDTFVAAHAALRVLLEHRYGRPAAAWRFGRQPLGRPIVVEPPDGSDPRISLTHADGLAAAAVCEGHAVGIDAERIDPSRFAVGELDALLAPEETIAVRAAPDPVRCFFAFWTLREALLKACGVGLTLPMASLALALSPDRLLRADPAVLPRGDWRFERLAPTARHVIALAADVPASPQLDFRLTIDEDL